MDSAKKSICGVYDRKIQFRTASEPISKVNIWRLNTAYAASPLSHDRIAGKGRMWRRVIGGLARFSHRGWRSESALARLSKGTFLTRLKPGRQHKGRTVGHNARDKSKRMKWNSEAKRRK